MPERGEDGVLRALGNYADGYSEDLADSYSGNHADGRSGDLLTVATEILLNARARPFRTASYFILRVLG
jgi:hypothetical protein